jgi:hypothetical protein
VAAAQPVDRASQHRERLQEASASLSVGGAYVPVLHEPSEHLLLGVGPSVATTLHSSITFGSDTEDADKRTVGIAGVLAGWF